MVKLSLVQKCQTSGRSGIVVYFGGNIVFGAKRSISGCGGCSQHSQIVLYGDGNIVFRAKRSNQWTQWNSAVFWWEHCLWVFGAKKVKPVDTMDAVNIVE